MAVISIEQWRHNIFSAASVLCVCPRLQQPRDAALQPLPVACSLHLRGREVLPDPRGEAHDGQLRSLVQAVDELVQHQHHMLRSTWPHSVRTNCPRWRSARIGLRWSGRSCCTRPATINGQRPPPSFSCSAVQPSMTVRRPASVTLRRSMRFPAIPTFFTSLALIEKSRTCDLSTI